MALIHSPNTVTSNLVELVDAGNQKSYSPNVLPNPTDIFAWCGGAGLNACTIARDPNPPAGPSPAGGIPLRMNVTGNDPHIGCYNSTPWNLAPLAIGQTWTVSVWVSASVATTGELLLGGANTSGNVFAAGTFINGAAVNVTTGWTRVSFSVTIPGTATSASFVQIRLDGPNTGGTGQTLWWDGLQVERAATPTTFNAFPNINGTNWNDVSGNARNGTLINAPFFDAANRNSLLFDGVDEYVDLPTSLSNVFTSNAVTVMGFGRISSVVQKNTFVSFNGVYNFFMPGNRLGPTQQLYWDATTGWIGTVNTTWTVGQWYHFAWSINSSRNLIMYTNGIQDTSATIAVDFAPAASTAVRIGFANAGEFATGNIGLVQIYNRALTAVEVNQNYQALRSRFGI